MAFAFEFRPAETKYLSYVDTVLMLKNDILMVTMEPNRTIIWEALGSSNISLTVPLNGDFPHAFEEISISEITKLNGTHLPGHCNRKNGIWRNASATLGGTTTTPTKRN
ncbi:uncharacterized protein TM35_000045180 [Trypanosoma theileri]|uniref:Uncharacterized protein n=1 Tax=Trypanosoma theileri TaxID=67003 RepID=A0A1X0P5S9_9TRYP|nr:uncharacterized protein TM35_000045180 [Trypanosoma theileri]ORC92304.1 hypothetical protein TM35_000045180 [Trypanosoma theileri]